MFDEVVWLFNPGLWEHPKSLSAYRDALALNRLKHEFF